MRPLPVIILTATMLLGVCSLRPTAPNKPPICVGGGSAAYVAPADDPLPAELRTSTVKAPLSSELAGFVAELQKKYHIGDDEAWLRLVLQAELGLLLAARYPMSLGQISLDYSQGLIVVATTDRAALTADPELSAYAHRDRVVFRQTRWSSRETQAASMCLWTYIGEVDSLVQLILP